MLVLDSAFTSNMSPFQNLHQSPQPTLPSPDAGRDALPIARDDERALPDARRRIAGASKGNKNALKHGRYTAETIANRREIAALVRERKGPVEMVDRNE